MRKLLFVQKIFASVEMEINWVSDKFCEGTARNLTFDFRWEETRRNEMTDRIKFIKKAS